MAGVADTRSPSFGFFATTSGFDAPAFRIVTVLKGGAAKPEVVAKNPKLGERVSATPAIADDTLYVRTAGHVYAFSEKK